MKKTCPSVCDSSIKEAIKAVVKDNQKNFLYLLPFSEEKNAPFILEMTALLSEDRGRSALISEKS